MANFAPSFFILSFVLLSSSGYSAIADDNAWCVAKNFADEKVLQSNIDFACSNQVDCGPIQSGGSCFLPDTVYSHACFAMNSYFKLHKTLESCQFNSTGVVVIVDPSYGDCRYL